MTKRTDPSGKRALFESPPIEIADPIKDDPLVGRETDDSHEVLYSAGHHEPGTVVISCSRCEVRSRVSVIESLVRIAAISVWVPVPVRAYNRWLQCPACQTRSWCRIEWSS